MRSTMHRRHLLLGTVVSSLVLVTCALFASATASAGPVSSTSARAGGSLVVGLTGGIAALDPNTASTAPEDALFPLLWDGLTRYGQDMSAQPDLATSWTHTADLRTWTFKLRHGVKFANGRGFTSKDVVLNMHRALDKKVGDPNYSTLSVVESIKAPGPYTVVLHLKSPNSFLPVALVVLKITDLVNKKSLTTTANGTGPYKLSQFVPSDHVVLVPNPNYWGPKAPLDKLTLTNVQDPTSGLAALRAGKLNVLWGVSARDSLTLKSDSSLRIVKPQVASGNVAWELDTTSPPFNNVLARRALSYAIDRKAILATAYAGQGVVSLENDPISANNPFYDGKLTKYDFNLQKAKQLFTAAGVKPGTTITYWAVAGQFPEWVTAGEILQQDLKKIDINLVIKTNELQTWLNKFYPPGHKYPATIIANYLSLPPVPPYIVSFFDKGTCDCNWFDPAFPPLELKGSEAPTVAAQRTAYARVQALLNKQVPIMVLMQNTIISVAQTNVTGIWSDSLGDLHLDRAGLSS